MQLIAHKLGGSLESSQKREDGKSTLYINKKSSLFTGLTPVSTVWMSHGDHVEKLPKGFSAIASTEDLQIAAMENTEKNIYALQFHPEVSHTEFGGVILERFLDICNMERNWTAENQLVSSVAKVKEQIADGKVIIAYSGGVDSTVMTAIVQKAAPDRFYPIFVDTGLLRKDEGQEVRHIFSSLFNSELIYEDASEVFFERLKGVEEPEQKRKVIGHTFIDVFTKAAKRIEGVTHLAQGTLYPDVIESVSTKGPSASIKSHHNVGGLPDVLNFELVEPLRELFKDEVRSLGAVIGLPHEALWRHPFPGPGLAVRILGEITPERVKILQEADNIFIRLLKETGYYNQVWPAFAVLLPVKSVGVMGDERNYENTVILRSVNSTDGMTADWSRCHTTCSLRQVIKLSIMSKA
jgi:GMP synthase (glutamine-hydrolysing)